MTQQQLKHAYPRCQWCHGTGCLACDAERRMHQERASQPIFSAQRDDPEDMEALRRVFGRDALDHAFGPEGRGMAEIEENAAIESLKQALRKSRPETQDAPAATEA